MHNSAQVELIFDRDCPHVEPAREAIRHALARVGRLLIWKEWDRYASDTPQQYRHYGSPTVLVNGQDVCGGERDGPIPLGQSCRIYREDGCLCVAPSAEMIVAAISGALVR